MIKFLQSTIYVLLLFLAITTSLSAQISNQLFLPQPTELLNLTAEELQFVEQVRVRPFVADVQLVRIANIFDLQENGYVRFSFPDPLPRDVLVETLDIQYEAADNYRYKGIVRNIEGLSIGELILNRLPQGYSGDFRFNEQAYELIHLREGLNILTRKQISNDIVGEICSSIFSYGNFL